MAALPRNQLLHAVDTECSINQKAQDVLLNLSDFIIIVQLPTRRNIETLLESIKFYNNINNHKNCKISLIFVSC